ncbi:MAG: 2-oxo-4-hydroxy-4-carboxy-5-ureidoimidazoline decarboxylase [Pseudonocardiales bacterium]|jgi:2-oxo-4-hydroxy-4-carboxy-5-ureidoimidazoline decarboxylase|nr:2-oxo-4-hydroxy-4-carboxy-5-ureidoimidazoline decarboxylase [Pseudonocardiales bacterium]MDT4941305.1 2-oxo-4-hydroxy-4-carboxy-5-ureidoimidazoline decarboxylase [Pseudonocardiales bacterium]
MDLAGFNRASTADVEAALLECCSSAQWARAVAARRPYASVAALDEAADAALDDLDEAELGAALAGHPRIGERAAATHAASSTREQSGVAQSSAATLTALRAGNEEYEARFGHVYLVCADGRSGDELLAVLRGRLGNDAASEWATTRTELGKINRLRLARLIGADQEAS